MTTQDHEVVAVCDTGTEAEQAVREILKAGFDMDNLSIGVPRSGIGTYEKVARQGKIVLTLQGTANEVARARQILATSGLTEAIAPDRQPLHNLRDRADLQEMSGR